MLDDQLALVHYRLLFPTLESLGDGDPPDTWKTEYDRVSASAFSELTVTQSSGGDGSQVGGVKNYTQSTLLTALHTRRAELDPDYAAVAFAPSSIPPYRSLGVTVRLGY